MTIILFGQLNNNTNRINGSKITKRNITDYLDYILIYNIFYVYIILYIYTFRFVDYNLYCAKRN